MTRKLKNSELPRLSPDTFKQAQKTPLILVLDNVRSLNNIGSIFRTADAFLVQKIYLCGITACPPHKDIQKTALGASLTVNWSYSRDCLSLLQELKRQGNYLWAVEQTEQSQKLGSLKPNLKKPQILIFGNEVKGVQQEVVSFCDGVIEIPLYGTKHSLNISVCAGIVIWEFFKKLQK